MLRLANPPPQRVLHGWRFSAAERGGRDSGADGTARDHLVRGRQGHRRAQHPSWRLGPGGATAGAGAGQGEHAAALHPRR